jgi:predicted RNA-binding Zn-ribbon protein involved in translation (DUF1610 family)
MATVTTELHTPIAPSIPVDLCVVVQAELEAFAARMLRPGVDYGVMPGTRKEDGKPPRQTLYKAGAVKLCGFFGLVPVFEEDRAVNDFERGLFAYDFTCQLLRCARRVIQDGQAAIVGDYAGCGLGSANSREKKYRRGARTCPDCGASTIKRSKYPPRANKNAEPGWYCHAQAAGCGKEFAADDKAIVDQPLVADPLEAAELVNTIRAMAAKRALVAAVLLATNASTLFEADVDSGRSARVSSTDTTHAGGTKTDGVGSVKGTQADRPLPAGNKNAAPSSPASTNQGTAVNDKSLLKEARHLLATLAKTEAKAVEFACPSGGKVRLEQLTAAELDKLVRHLREKKPAVT